MSEVTVDDQLAPTVRSGVVAGACPSPEPTRYLLFAGNEYFALGGWRDMQAGFSDLTTAMNAAASLPEEQWVQLVDLQTMRPIVSRGEAYGTTIENPFAPPHE